MENKVPLKSEQSRKLGKLPEQGMGYQIVDVTLKSGKVLKARVVLNSSYLKLETGERIDPEDIEKVELNS